MAREREGKSQEEEEEEEEGKTRPREDIELGPNRCEREAEAKPVEF